MLAGFVYFALIFALGFALGALRTLVAPDAEGSGRFVAVAAELPVMLAASWLASGAVIRRFEVVAKIGPRLVMGGFAFALLLLAETLLGVLLLGRTPGEQAALYAEPSYALGLAAQIAFALMPAMRLAIGRRA